MLNDYPKSRSDCPNCPKCFVVVPSVSDGKVRNASRETRALQQNSGAERLSKMRVNGVQNGAALVSRMAKLLKSAIAGVES